MQGPRKSEGIPGSGLHNPLNECYMNSALQALNSCQCLVDTLRKVYNGQYFWTSQDFGAKLLRLFNEMRSGQKPKHAREVVDALYLAYGNV